VRTIQKLYPNLSLVNTEIDYIIILSLKMALFKNDRIVVFSKFFEELRTVKTTSHTKPPLKKHLPEFSLIIYFTTL